MASDEVSNGSPVRSITPRCKVCGGGDGLRQVSVQGGECTLCAACASKAAGGRLEVRRVSRWKRSGRIRAFRPYQQYCTWFEYRRRGGAWRKASCGKAAR